MLAFDRTLLVGVFALSLGGCPLDPPANPVQSPAQSMASTHTGLVSIQDVSIANLPQAGHGLTLQALFTPVRAPDFSAPVPGTPFGCQASLYDLSTEPAPSPSDQGQLEIAGLNGGTLRCEHREGRGYLCPTASGQGRAELLAAQSVSTYRLEDLQLSAADIGRYLQVSGSDRAENNGAFAILAVEMPDRVVVANGRGVSDAFDATYEVLAGAGPTPGDLYEPYVHDSKLRVALTPAGEDAFDAFEVEVQPGEPMTLDKATARQIVAIEPNGDAITLGCDGDGGHCGAAAASVIRITSTDGDTTGLPSTAMPPAQRRLVEIQCAFPDTGTVRVPAGAMDLLRRAHRDSPITRIRSAFMREGFAIATNAAPRPGNSVVVLVGHGILGFSDPTQQP
jgi:hypothetical protein